jgi:hypothetical protein
VTQGTYSFAARVTVGYDGGNHPRHGDLLRCPRCAALILRGDEQVHDREHETSALARANLSSLNDIIAEMTAKVSDDPEFTSMVRELLRGHSRSLGYHFQGD